MAQMRLSQVALGDIQAIDRYLARERPAALRGVMRGLLNAFNQLELFPASGALALTLDDGRSYRVSVAGSYLVYYRLLDEDVGFVARVWDARKRRPTTAAQLEPDE